MLDDGGRRKLECSMREGHSCPVFRHYSHSTETIEPRRSSRYIPHDVMFNVARRDDYKCQLCFRPVRDDEIEFDHVIPVAKGGPTTVANIRLLCRAATARRAIRRRTSGPRQVLVYGASRRAGIELTHRENALRELGSRSGAKKAQTPGKAG